MTTDPPWIRITSEAAFRAAFTDRHLTGEGLSFMIRSDGTITGTAGSARLAGTWSWQGGLFCRTASLDGEDLGSDREIIERSGDRMRYTRDCGEGERHIAVRSRQVAQQTGRAPATPDRT